MRLLRSKATHKRGTDLVAERNAGVSDGGGVALGCDNLRLPSSIGQRLPANVTGLAKALYSASPRERTVSVHAAGLADRMRPWHCS
jgi:hypothetical protein